MIRRLLNALAALLLLGLGLVGLPAFLLGAYRALDAQMPDLVDLPSVLLSPGDGGLFLLLLFAIGWACWAVFTTAFAVEVIARARGIRTPHLGAFFPQATMAQAVSSVALMLTLTPVAAHAIPPASAHAAAPATTTSQAAPAPTVSPAHGQHEAKQAHRKADDAYLDYVVERGDTLWDIADEQLDDPTRYPEIFKASDHIDQPEGQHLTDPDLILPGWTLHVPTDTKAPKVQPAEPAPTPGPASAGDSPAEGEQVVPPTTPMQSPDTHGQDDTPDAAAMGPAVAALPTTPMSAPSGESANPTSDAGYREAVYDDEGRFAPTHGVLGLPSWITDPLIPTRPEGAPELIAAATASLAAYTAARADDPARTPDDQP